MALKFVRRRSNLAPQKRKIITQRYDAIDQFGDVASRKRTAGVTARKLGHDLRGWTRRSNDPAGRWNNWCFSCNRALVVCTETPEGFDDIYGPAYTEPCVTPEP